MSEHFARRAADELQRGLGRRTFFRAATAVAAAGTVTGTGLSAAAAAVPMGAQHQGGARPGFRGTVLQPGKGRIPGDHYLPSDVDGVLWGYVPSLDAEPSLRMRSGRTVTIDAVSHEGILEDQGRDPLEFFGEQGVSRGQVLEDAIEIARDYDRTERDFDRDGPHVVTGPVFVEEARPGDVLKIETLHADLRVPYGVVSSRHGKGALPRAADGGAPAGIELEEVMPPVGTDGRATGEPEDYGTVSVFTPVERGQGVMGEGRVRFPLRPFMGMMGVAYAQGAGPTDGLLNSIPPTLGGGNIDIRHLGVGSTFYLPVQTDGALFYVGDPHMAMGDGEVALTAMEGSLRGTFRLTVCKAGEGDAPSVAHAYPFAETDEHWIPIGLSDPDGAAGGQGSDLDVAMRRAVVNALDFLETDRGMDRAVAYAYLSAAADFAISQVVDRTVGVHGLIRKADFDRS
ncbi:acetamidase/formamidase family protein [uncultured Kocuria sp.]|uniref:acetamidase/formamidase family protein n=1 Tax=uncultured Kocuria sp. TaxID=259305 RepID=UPI0026323C3A|nr:acetamidase/formamidase family protein [uncultured Kocuria sp.]